MPFSSMTKACSVPCSLELVEDQKRKIARKDLRDGRERLKTKSGHLADAQKAFNRYIRARDHDEPCISCGTRNPLIQYCAGHYFTVGGHPELRFEELNVHKQCNKNCNMELSGNIAAYRVNLVKKIGEPLMAWLEGPHQAKNYIIEDIKMLKAEFNARALKLEKEFNQ